jgi:hypothetical protein
MAQQLQQMPPVQQRLQPSEPCSPEVPTQSDINAIVGATQLLEGQNSMLNQMVYDVIQGRYGEPSQNSLADSLSQSLSASMVEQARLFNLLVEYVNQDQPQASDSILPPSRLPMDLREEERSNRGNKRVLSEIDVSEWEITCKETRPREGKRRCDTSKATQLPVGGTLTRATRLRRKKKKKRLRLIKKGSNKSPGPETFHPVCATIVDNPSITQMSAQTPDSRSPSNRRRTPDPLMTTTATSQAVKWGKANQISRVTPLCKNLFPTSSCSFESQDKILLKGGRL